MVIPEWCCFLISFSFISNFVQYFSLNVHEFIVANTRLHKTPQALNVLQYIIIKKNDLRHLPSLSKFNGSLSIPTKCSIWNKEC